MQRRPKHLKTARTERHLTCWAREIEALTYTYKSRQQFRFSENDGKIDCSQVHPMLASFSCLGPLADFLHGRLVRGAGFQCDMLVRVLAVRGVRHTVRALCVGGYAVWGYVVGSPV